MVLFTHTVGVKLRNSSWCFFVRCLSACSRLCNCWGDLLYSAALNTVRVKGWLDLETGADSISHHSKEIHKKGGLDVLPLPARLCCLMTFYPLHSLHSPELPWIRSKKEARFLVDSGWSYENFCLNDCEMHDSVLLLLPENAQTEVAKTQSPHRRKFSKR